MALRDLVPWHRTREELRLPERPSLLEGDPIRDFFRSWVMAPWSLLTEESAAFAPAANVSETEDEYRVSVELAGMGKDDVGVSIQEGRLTISGEKRKEEQEEKENYLRYERSYGSFTRTIPLPTSVDEGRISAKFKDGVLTVRLPKRPEARGKKVEITEG